MNCFRHAAGGFPLPPIRVPGKIARGVMRREQSSGGALAHTIFLDSRAHYPPDPARGDKMARKTWTGAESRGAGASGAGIADWTTVRALTVS